MEPSFDDALDQLRRLRRTMLSDLHELESGLGRHSEKQAGEWVDITPQLIKAWRDEVEQLGRLIAMYEERFTLVKSDLSSRRKA